MGEIKSRDKDWAGVENMLCRVDDFQPTTPRVGARGMLTLTCLEKRGTWEPGTQATVLHKLDYANLCAALIERGVADDELAVVVWSKRYSYRWARWLSAFMPRMTVVIFKKRSLELLFDDSLEPNLRGLERHKATVWVAEFRPYVLT